MSESEELPKVEKLPACPQCGAEDGLRQILYGLPAAPLTDEEALSYTFGGCCVTGDDPELSCEACEWAGTWVEANATNTDL